MVQSQFVNLPLCELAILSICLSVFTSFKGLFGQLNQLSSWSLFMCHFANMAMHQHDIMYTGHFVNMTLFQDDILNT
jgi:hypothetical protein